LCRVKRMTGSAAFPLQAWCSFRPPPTPNEEPMHNYLDFEKPISDLEGKIHELKKLGEEDESVDTREEIARLEARARDAMADIYAKLTPWQKTQVARHPSRPHFLDYARELFTEFTPLAGDRKFAEDEAIQAGLGRFQGAPVAIIGQEKGHDTKSRIRHNFGSAKPEGYRKAIRIMEMADRFQLPIVTLIDTAGAYPGIGAEERGQAEAIARSTEMCLKVKVPIVSVIIGEGGSGGAIAIATGNRVYMLEHSIYSVISPEGAASILWRDSAKAKDAAMSMKITAEDLKALGIIDDIIEEPVGGAHRDAKAAIEATGDVIAAALKDLGKKDGDTLVRERRQKYLDIGRQQN
jgi:acetyl-CoA carboxylase carboxyl transferase subunit alpha